MIPVPPLLPPAATARVQDQVAAGIVLWEEFFDLLSRYGSVDVECTASIRFRQSNETQSRVLNVSPHALREAFVNDAAYRRLRGERVSPILRLPVWFVDEVVEFIGSVEEPYEHPFVVLVGLRLCESQDGEQPLAGATAC